MAITKVSTELLKDNSVTINKLHSDTVVTVSKGLHNHVNDNGIPTAGAVASYVSSQVTGANDWNSSFAWGDHSTYGYATETYVDNSIANVINSAPAALDTLNELAAALGDDPNFATTVSTSIGTAQSTANTALTNANAALAKDPTLTISGDASGSATFTNLGNATLSLTIADDSHNHIISNIDGLQTALDGKQAAGTYNTIIGTDTDIDTSGATIVDNIYVTDGVITSMGTRTLTLGDLGYTGATNANYITNNNQLTNGAGYLTTSGKAADSNLLDGLDSTQFFRNGDATLQMTNNDGFVYNDVTNTMYVKYDGTDYPIWTSANDGAGSGLDADLLDGLNSSRFVYGGEARKSNQVSAFANVNEPSGFYFGNNVANAPTTDWINYMHSVGNNWSSSNNYSFQLTHAFHSDDLWVSRTTNGSQSAARLILDSGGGTQTKGGILQSNASLRAPLFYDSNNTSYYVNPDSLSVVSDLAVRLSGDVGHSRIQIGDIPNGTGGRVFTSDNRYRLLSSVNLYDTQASSWGRDVSAGAAAVDLILTNPTSGAGRINFLADSSGTGYPSNQMTVYGEGYVTASNSFRAPIFYDSNDTGYYLDPTSTSDSALRIRGGALFGPNTTWSSYLMVGGNGRSNYTNQTSTASVVSTNGNLHLDAASGFVTLINFYDGGEVCFGSGSSSTVGKILSDGSARFPIFYDYNNTGYYVDPAGQSRMGNIERNTHSTGFLVGSYNTAGANDAKTNPIYTIGNSYKPTDTSISGMYGIGYAHANLWGSGKTTGWGLYVASNGAYNCTIGAGATTIWAQNDIVAYSDRRVKDNIEIIPNAIEKVKQLNGVTFTRTDANEEDKDKRHTGVIAQDVLKVLPEAVVGSEEDLYSVAYGNMVGLLIEAIKEQQAQIEELKQLINKQ